tara:strand:+ start:601 stop:1038 length:438 start_codon:yes stop_codon:yes gene_type:complete
MKKLLFSALIISLLAFGCSGTPSVKDSSSRAELTVTYYGDEVHRRGGEYVTGSELRDLIFNKKQEVFVIFTAPWCGACKIVKKAIKQANLDFKVHLVNLEDPWAKLLGQTLEITRVPLMVHIGKDGNAKVAKEGPGPIMVYLLTQ